MSSHANTSHFLKLQNYLKDSCIIILEIDAQLYKIHVNLVKTVNNVYI